MSLEGRLIETATAEVGYLEKRSAQNLDDKTANAGEGNYTKYWRDIKPEWQGQPWCACFVTWCFEKTFGRKAAEILLRHYPYVYCPIIAELFELRHTPQKGDIVIFKQGGKFTHTGIVTEVSGNRFTTVEGNTSASEKIIPNGGAVCQKGYYIRNVPGAEFIRPDYGRIESEEDLDMTKYEEVDSRLKELAKENDRQNDIINRVGKETVAMADMINTITETLKSFASVLEKFRIFKTEDEAPNYAKDALRKALKKGALRGDENGNLNITEDMARICVVLDRMGLFD